MHDKRVAKFNYKLFSCILLFNFSVSKWNKDVSAECKFCQMIEDLFSCKLVKNTLQEVEFSFQFWNIMGNISFRILLWKECQNIE